MAHGSASLSASPPLISTARRNIPSTGLTPRNFPAIRRGKPPRAAAMAMACSSDGVLDLLEAAKRTIDFAFDDADIIEEGTLTAIIGRRKLESGESIIQEKSIVKTARSLAFIVSEKQYMKDLDGAVPVLVNSGNWMETAEEIDDHFLGDAEVWRRSSFGHAGPLGGDFPFVTRDGHHILDVIFTSPIFDLAQVAEILDQIDGVVDHGVISGIPCTAIIASKSGVAIINNLPKLHN